MQVTTIGLDLAKNVFQVHGIDADGRVVIRRKLRRQDVLAFFDRLPSCLIGIETCATAHHWAPELIKLGHTVKLMPPAHVKASGQRRCRWPCRTHGKESGLVSVLARQFAATLQ
jgi:transposase